MMLCANCGRENRSDAAFCDSCAGALSPLAEPLRQIAESITPSDQSSPTLDGESTLWGTFVGRQREMERLKVTLEDVFAGHDRLVMLAGEPGIGKTRTAQELASRAESLGAQVLWGRCYEEEGTPPYWPWVQPIRSYVQLHEAGELRSIMGAGASDIAEIVPELREKLPDLEEPPTLEPE